MARDATVIRPGTSAWIKRAGVLVLVLIVLGFGLAWRPGIALIAPPPAAGFAAASVALGAQLAGAGNCAGCHTVPGGPRFGGGLPLATGFGTVYSVNISPDGETGIGRWSLPAFARAMRHGVARDGSHLLPAFPYPHFTKLTDGDIAALYAFLMTREPVVAARKANTIAFPFDLRPLQAGWKLLFFDSGVYRPVDAKPAAWNRGAYLAEGVAHCAACHTPRNRFGAEQRTRAYAGATIDGWFAPPLDATNAAPLPWTQPDLYAYLRTGQSARHGAAAGSMFDVVHDGLAALPDDDIQAIATYFADVNDSENSSRTPRADAIIVQARARERADLGRHGAEGAGIYLAACASCHYDGGNIPASAMRPALALSSAVSADDPANMILVLLGGIGAEHAHAADRRVPYMPAFAGALTDADIASVIAYVRRTRTEKAAWPHLQATVAQLRHTNEVTP